MDAWQEEGQIIFSCLLCCFCSVNQLHSSESKNLFQDVNKSKVIKKGNVIPPCCSSLTHISKWKLFKDTTWGRLIGADESFGTWSWKCLLTWVALWLFAWVNSECMCKCFRIREEKVQSCRVLSRPLQWWKVWTWAPGSSGWAQGCVCVVLTVLLGQRWFGQRLPGWALNA